MLPTIIRIGTRKSPLALVQTKQVRDRLLSHWPGLQAEIVEIATSGDKFMQPLTDIGGKGLFTKEIEEALLDKSIDIAVHSMKDMPTVLPKGLIIATMPEREDPRDMLVGKNIFSIENIPQGATFGTSSLRRRAQLLMLRPDLRMIDFRGNVQTRLKKLEDGMAVATMLARAGLIRLQLPSVSGVTLPVETFLPAVAQGAIGIECRENDDLMRELLAVLSHAPTEMAVLCERSFLRELDGSCRTPIAGYAEISDKKIRLRGLIVKPDGSAHYRIESQGGIGDAVALGQQAGRELKASAGANFLGNR